MWSCAVHRDPWCKENLNANDRRAFDDRNTEACEQFFSGFTGYAPLLCSSTSERFGMWVLILCHLHNIMLVNRGEGGRWGAGMQSRQKKKSRCDRRSSSVPFIAQVNQEFEQRNGRTTVRIRDVFDIITESEEVQAAIEEYKSSPAVKASSPDLRQAFRLKIRALVMSELVKREKST